MSQSDVANSVEKIPQVQDLLHHYQSLGLKPVLEALLVLLLADILDDQLGAALLDGIDFPHDF